MDWNSFFFGVGAVVGLFLFFALCGRAIYGFLWSSYFLLANGGFSAWFRYLKEIPQEFCKRR